MLTLGLLLELVAGLFGGLTPPRRRMGRTGFTRIQTGMSEVEVWEILGGPPGEYTRERRIARGAPWPRPLPRQWVRGRAVIRVWLDAAEGRVIGKEILEGQRAPAGVLAALCRWLRG